MSISYPNSQTGKTSRIGAVLAGATMAMLAAEPAAANAKAVGVWYDDTGKGAVEIFPCDNKLCGRIVWLKEPLGKDGKPLFDGHNPQAEMRSRPICGLQVLGGLTAQPDGSWDEGWVYDPKVGKSYNAALELEGRDLVLTGYKGVRLLGKSFTWTKAPETLPKCSTPGPVNAAR